MKSILPTKTIHLSRKASTAGANSNQDKLFVESVKDVLRSSQVFCIKFSKFLMDVKIMGSMCEMMSTRCFFNASATTYSGFVDIYQLIVRRNRTTLFLKSSKEPIYLQQASVYCMLDSLSFSLPRSQSTLDSPRRYEGCENWAKNSVLLHAPSLQAQKAQVMQGWPDQHCLYDKDYFPVFLDLRRMRSLSHGLC